jgi:hypothetical protein
MNTRAILVATALGLGLAVTTQMTAQATQNPHAVDPATVTPGLNPTFGPWECFMTGTGITCEGDKLEEYAGPIGLQCGGADVYVTGQERSFMTRWHDLEGRAVKTSLQTNIDDRLGLSPSGDGYAVLGSGHWHKHYVYPVPGDSSARLLTETGAIMRIVAPGRGGLLFQDTGSVTYLPDQEYEGVAEMHGVHDRFTGASEEAAICQGLVG